MTVKLPIAETAPNAPGTDLGPDEDGKLLRVGDLAQRTQKTVRALHLYEELGLLKPSERSKGGFRMYGGDAVLRVRWISKLQDLNFTLPEIKEMLQEWERSGSAPGAMHRIHELYAQKLSETRAQITRLQALERELVSSITYLDTCEQCDPERLIHSCSRCDLHGCNAPMLVAGLHSQQQ